MIIVIIVTTVFCNTNSSYVFLAAQILLWNSNTVGTFCKVMHVVSDREWSQTSLSGFQIVL